jgi:hypothetical protein
MTAVLSALAMVAGLFLLLSGLAFFVVGLMSAKSQPWVVQYGYAAVALTGAFYLLSYALRA